MKGRYLSIIATITISSLAFVLASRLGHGHAGMARVTGEPNTHEHEALESPPEDWFISQRVSHGGIPAGALERAGAQAAALNEEAERTNSPAAAARWQFVGPTNIGGR